MDGEENEMSKTKPKIYIQKGDHKYLIVKYDKGTGNVVLRGMRDFKSNIEKAKAAGYLFFKEV